MDRLSSATAEGGSVAVKLLSVSGPQDFDGGQIGKPVEKLEGQMDLYLYESGTHVVLIGFRADGSCRKIQVL